MKHLVRLTLSLFLVLCVVSLMVGQTPTARIIVKGVSPDLKAAGRYDAISSGLPNVGKGQKVWFEAEAIYTTYLDTIISETWSVVDPPGGFAAVIHTDTTTYLIPDTTGQYLVTVNITSNHGASQASIYVNSATWVGVGTIVGTPNVANGECGACHAQKATDWAGTPHSRIFSFNVDSSTHYSNSCLSCHTVGYDLSPTAVNNGFDDIATQLGWSVPTPQVPGNWDTIKAKYPELAKKANVQCENCHGPGSLHMGQTAQNQIAVSYSADMCGQCHGKAMNHIKNYEWNNSIHSQTVGEPGDIEHMNGKSCARCHTAQGYVNETIDGNVSAAPYPDAQPVACAACHDPHNDSNPAQLRAASISTACDGCHITRISSRGLHHSHQSPMLNGSNGTPYGGQTSGVGQWGGYQFAGYKYPNSSHTQIADRCPTCHMATSTGGADTSLVPLPYSQWRGKLGGHTFKVVWDHDTPNDTTDDVVNPFGCKDCHGNVSMTFVRTTQQRIKTLLAQLSALLPQDTTTSLPKSPFAAGLTAVQKAAAYNYYFVANDGSYGVHNLEYASALLTSSIEMVQLGAGAADIATVADVPNDQGKQVQIVWNKFPAESYLDPVIDYLVLRQDSAGSSIAKTGVKPLTATSFRDMLGKVAGGSTVVLGGSVWTKVGEYKALNQPNYSLIVPTLFDSTISGGMKQTAFEVVGYTAKNTVYASVPMSGYSVDNLSPVAPSGLAAHSGVGVAILGWNPPTDADFKYFAIFRGTTPGFTPGANPVGTSTAPQYTDQSVVTGSRYYYKVAAFDFSGNESLLSNEVNLLVTTAPEGNGIPTEYALRQNSPNPFNPTTRISYQLPEAGHVLIQIYNTLGMRVATLVDHDQQAGYYSAVWNGKDNEGNSCATGIYIYKMDAGKYTSVKKMMLIK